MSKIVNVFVGINGEVYPVGLCGYVPWTAHGYRRTGGNPNANRFSGRLNKTQIVRTKGRIVQKRKRQKRHK